MRFCSQPFTDAERRETQNVYNLDHSSFMYVILVTARQIDLLIDRFIMNVVVYIEKKKEEKSGRWSTVMRQ